MAELDRSQVPGRRANDQSGWTVDTVYIALLRTIADRDAAMLGLVNERDKEYRQLVTDLDRLMITNVVALDRTITQALEAAREAVEKSEAATEKRFDAVNAFREQLADQTATLMPRIEAEQRISVTSDRVSEVVSRLDRLEGSSKGSTATIAFVFAALGAAGALFGIIATLLAVLGH